MIRQATQQDAPEIARLGAIFHQQAGWDEIPYNEADCATALTQLMETPIFLCYVAEADDVIVGMMAVVLSPSFFNHTHITGEEMFWWVSDKAPRMIGLRLLVTMEKRARELGCHTMHMKSVARLNGERMEKLYAKRGYRASERLFVKEL
jgi:L-amino acid N-acyltransferase YncA